MSRGEPPEPTAAMIGAEPFPQHFETVGTQKKRHSSQILFALKNPMSAFPES
jgi:hypothetical protein